MPCAMLQVATPALASLSAFRLSLPFPALNCSANFCPPLASLGTYNLAAGIATQHLLRNMAASGVMSALASPR